MTKRREAAEATALVEGARGDLAAERAEAQALLALAKELKRTLARSFWELGVALAGLARPAAYTALGYASFAALLADHELVSETQAGKLVAVVGQMPKTQALKLGVERSYALVRYARATGAVEGPRALLASGATLGDKPLAEASVAELATATRNARQRERPPSPERRAATRREEALLKAWRAALRDLGVTRPTLALGRGVVRITLPRAQAERLLGDE